MILNIENLSKSFGENEILDNINMTIEQKDRIGLIGNNGVGKSTLLNIIAGNMEYDKGTINIKKDLKIGYLRQVDVLNENNTIKEEIYSIFSFVYDIQKKIENLQIKMKEVDYDSKEYIEMMQKYNNLNNLFEANDGYNIDYKIKSVLNGLGFLDFNLDEKISKLSGGEKIRLSLSKILLINPDLLILDEPTNHLDFEMLDWLEKYLKSYKGAIFVVSHDRYFLDKTVNKIYEIENKKLYKYNGNYTDFILQKQEKIKKEQKDYEENQEKIKKLKEFVDKNLAKSSSVNSVGTRVKQLEKMEKLEKPEKPMIFNKNINLNFEIANTSYEKVLKVENLKVDINDKTLYEKINFKINRKDKVAIIGKNGVGKTTLLKAIQGMIKYSGKVTWGENVKISYFDQESKLLNKENTVINEIHNHFPDMNDLDIRKLLARLLITDEQVFKKIKELSGANRAKVVFAKIMLEKSNVIILDEPTNHLDYMAKEELNRSLKEYKGTIIMVSHDRYLLNNVANKILELTDSGIYEYNGNYDYYLENKSEIIEKKDEKISLSKEYNMMIRENRKRISSIEKKIDILEKEIKDLNLMLENPEISNDYVELSKISKKIEEKNVKLNELLLEWENLNEKI